MKRRSLLTLCVLILLADCVTGVRREITQTTSRDPKFSDLTNVLNSDKPKTVAEFLAGVAKRFPYYFRAYTLAYHSKSIQGASFQNPRALVYGETGQMIMTFNGDPGQESYAGVETLEFDPERGPLFRAIEFRSEANVYEFDGEELDPQLSTEHIYVTKSNPHTCQTCHGTEVMHVNWHEYFNWPGFYGSDDDGVFRKKSALNRGFQLTSDFDPEKENFQKLGSQFENHPRYKFLNYLIRGLGEVYTYTSYGLNVVDYKKTLNFWNQSDAGPETRPNLQLTLHLFQNTGIYYAHRILRDSTMRKYRFALVSSALCIDDLSQVEPQLTKAVPKKLLASHHKAVGSVSVLAGDFTQNLHYLQQDGFDIVKQDFDGRMRLQDFSMSGFQMDHLIAASTLLGKPWGFDPALHSPNTRLVPSFNSGTARAGFTNGMIREMALFLNKEDGYDLQNLEDLIVNLGLANAFRPHKEICEKLTSDSLRALKGVRLVNTLLRK